MKFPTQALSGDFQHAYGKMYVGVRWCAMCILLFLKFYNFIKGIMRICVVFLKKPKTNVFRLYLLPCSNIYNL